MLYDVVNSDLRDVVDSDLGDVIDGGLGDVGLSVGVNQGGAHVSANVSLVWLGLAGLLGWLWYKHK